jgi:uncharacterized protein
MGKSTACDTRMADELTADDIRTLLALEPNATCGFVRISYLSVDELAAKYPSVAADVRAIANAVRADGGSA